MRSIISDHLRGNIVGYIALFLVLTGGTAYALDGSNTVFSDDIVNGEVKTPDIAKAAVTNSKLANGSVTNSKLGANAVRSGKVADGTLQTADLADGSVNGAKVLDNSLGTDDLADGSVNGAKVLDNSLGTDDLADGSVNGAKVLDDSLGADDIGIGAVGSDEIADGSIAAGDISSAPPFGNGGFNGDEKIIDGSIIGFFDIAPNTVGEGQIADSYGSAGSGTDGACFDDDNNGEVCASTTFTLAEPGKVLLNATGQWRTFSSPPVSMTCVLQADGANVGLAQSFGENGSNHTGTGPDGTMALTGLTGTLAAGSHTFQTFCTTTDSDIDLLSNQITAARVDG
jgi:hypothetical protein